MTPPPLGAENAHVWAVRLDGNADGAAPSLEALSADERQRADEFRLERPRRQFVITRRALRRLLAQYLVLPPAEVEFTFEAIAKPRLAKKHAMSELRFNVTHSGDLALVAVTRGCDMGVDVERFRTVKQLEQLARRYFHPQEIEAVLQTPREERNAAFLRCWTAKEAVLKAFGTGIAGCLDAFAVPLDSSFAGWIDLSKLQTSGKAASCWLERLKPNDDYPAAVAFVGAKRLVQCFAFAS
jgi:4'-phosphopantetheinyl transferase